MAQMRCSCLQEALPAWVPPETPQCSHVMRACSHLTRCSMDRSSRGGDGTRDFGAPGAEWISDLNSWYILEISPGMKMSLTWHPGWAWDHGGRGDPRGLGKDKDTPKHTRKSKNAGPRTVSSPDLCVPCPRSLLSPWSCLASVLGHPPSLGSPAALGAPGGQGSMCLGTRPPPRPPAQPLGVQIQGPSLGFHPCLEAVLSCEQIPRKIEASALGDTYQVHQWSPGVPVLQGEETRCELSPEPTRGSLKLCLLTLIPTGTEMGHQILPPMAGKGLTSPPFHR